MKRLILTAISAALTLSVGAKISFAQDDGPSTFRPVEMWACTFNDGKDQEDMDEAYSYFAEEPGETRYAAYQLNPYFVGGRNEDFDFIFLGVWDSGSEMGADMATGSWCRR